MGGGIWVRFSTLGRRRSLCPGEDEVQGLDSASAWCTGRLLGCRSLGVWPRSLTLGGSVQRGACLYSSPGEGSVERGARTWTLRGDPGLGRAGELGAPRREALFHFPALLRFLRSVSLTSLNFTALGLRPTSPAPGRKRVPGLGAFPGQGVAPPGRARIRPGAPALCGAPSLRPHLWFPRAFLEGGLSRWGPGGGVCL